MRRRVLSLVLTLCMLLGLTFTMALATGDISSGTCGKNVTWRLTADGTLILDGSGETYFYNDGIGGHPENVPWFDHVEEIKKIWVGNEITLLSDYLFSDCDNVTELEIESFNRLQEIRSLPNSLQKITADSGEKYFSDGVALYEIIGTGEFRLRTYPQASSLTSYTVKSGTKVIMDFAFDGARNLKEIILPEGLTEIECCAFWGCVSLEKLALPDSLTTLDYSAFYFCASLDPIDVPPSVTTFKKDAFCPYPPNDDSTQLKAWIFKGDAPSVWEHDPYESYCIIYVENGGLVHGKSLIYYPKNASGWDALAQQYTSEFVEFISYDPAVDPTPPVELTKTTVTVQQPNGVFGQPLPAPSVKAENTDGTGAGKWSYSYYKNSGSTFGDSSSVETPINAGLYTVTATYTDSKYTGSGSVSFAIVKAPAPAVKAVTTTLRQDSISDKNTFNVTSTLPKNRGETTYTLGQATQTYSILKDTTVPEINDSGVLTYSVNEDAPVGESFTVPVTAIMQNYEEITFNVTITISERHIASDNVPTAGGSTTTTLKNPDGSTTKTVTNKRTGTVTETTTAKDGTKTVVETTKDGKVTTTITDCEGGQVSIVVDNGKTTIALSGGKTQAVVEFPAQVGPGTAAILVAPDGTETVLKTAVPSENGMKLLISQNATVQFRDNAMSFTDVPASHWAKGAIDFVTSREIFNGMGDGIFDPEVKINRAMMATLLFRLAEGQSQGKSSFADVAADAWYAEPVSWADNNGIVTGYDANTFAPFDLVTREQMAVMFYRYAKLLKMDTTIQGNISKYTDMAASSEWAVEAMTWCVGTGLVNGTSDTTLSPNESATRAQVAAMLMRMVELMVK